MTEMKRQAQGKQISNIQSFPHTDVAALAEKSIDPASGRSKSVFAELALPDRIDLGADFLGLLKQQLVAGLQHFSAFKEADEDRTGENEKVQMSSLSSSRTESESNLKSKSLSDSSKNANSDLNRNLWPTSYNQSFYDQRFSIPKLNPDLQLSPLDKSIRRRFSAVTCSLGPNCYFKNLCFQQFETRVRTHAQQDAKGRLVETTTNTTRFVDFAMLLSKEQHSSLSLRGNSLGVGDSPAAGASPMVPTGRL